MCWEKDRKAWKKFMLIKYREKIEWDRSGIESLIYVHSEASSVKDLTRTLPPATLKAQSGVLLLL